MKDTDALYSTIAFNILRMYVFGVSGGGIHSSNSMCLEEFIMFKDPEVKESILV